MNDNTFDYNPMPDMAIHLQGPDGAVFLVYHVGWTRDDRSGDDVWLMVVPDPDHEFCVATVDALIRRGYQAHPCDPPPEMEVQLVALGKTTDEESEEKA